MNRRTRSCFAVAVAIAAAPCSVGHAQGIPTLASLQPGDTIKVWAVAPRLNGVTGALAPLRRDTLVLAAVPLASPPVIQANVPYQSLRRVDLRRGERRSVGRSIIGGVLGAVAGSLLGGAVGGAIAEGSDCGDEFCGAVGFVIGFGAGGAVGATTGALIGARKRPHWMPVALR